LAVHVAWIYKQKNISKHDFATLKQSFRRICSGISNAYRVLSIQNLDEARIIRISNSITTFKESLFNLIEDYTTEEMKEYFEGILLYISSSDFLNYAFQCEEWKDVAVTLGYYLEIMK